MFAPKYDSELTNARIFKCTEMNRRYICTDFTFRHSQLDALKKLANDWDHLLSHQSS
jgi:hypothetical protein